MNKNSQNNNFLQSEEWRRFQESVGRKTFFVESDGFSASLIEHKLPIVGKYLYIPRGPLVCHPELDSGSQEIPDQVRNDIKKIINLAQENNAGWVRIDPRNENVLDLIKENINYKIVKAPHYMQPKEIFVIDISKTEEELLVEMSQKTRYNIKLAQKRGVSVQAISNDKFPMTNQVPVSNDKNYYIEEFLRLTKEMAERQGIKAHPEEYYRKMIEIFPAEMLKIYAAEYEDKIIAANLMLFFNDTATYLHGASGNEYRNLMAPHLLQWQAILDAKNAGCKFYDFGGVKSEITNFKLQIPNEIQNSKFKIQNSPNWQGITKFKLGFSPETKPMEFPGSYDIIIDRNRYFLYRILQKIKSLL